MPRPREGGIRIHDGLAASVTCGFGVARNAKVAINAVNHCTLFNSDEHSPAMQLGILEGLFPIADFA